jgi:oxygen-independent coproporphyrinogen-3 oxidase
LSGIYFHIPFCKQACSYCDFYFVTRQNQRDSFVKALLQEIKSHKNSTFTDEPVRTIYFGGGTPSLLLPEQIDAILSALQHTFPVEAEEITLEMNPDDVSAGYLSALKEAGINRASMGVQTFQPELLTFMNRAHTRREALQCLELLSGAGFDSFTVDLIYGNPNQTIQQLSNDLDLLLSFSPPHVSAYSLTIEPKTRLGKQVELRRITPPADDAVADQFKLINERLKEHHVQRYEVSNYSKPNREALHNSNYWRHENYLGFGPGAHSFWWQEKAQRWENRADLRAYLEDPVEPKSEEALTLNQLAEERIMMGLRTREGLSIKMLNDLYRYTLNTAQKAYLNQQEEKQMLHVDDKITLTDRGILLADAITLDLIMLQEKNLH